MKIRKSWNHDRLRTRNGRHRVARMSYIKRDSVDTRGLAAMGAQVTTVCNQSDEQGADAVD